MTSRMIRSCLTAAMAFSALAAVVALAPVSSAEAGPEVSRFAGSWSGTWSIAERGVGGTFDWSISDAGQITGRIEESTSGRGGTMAGHVGAEGKLMFLGKVPSDTPGNGENGYPYQGTAVIDGDGKLVVSALSRDSARYSLVAILERN